MALLNCRECGQEIDSNTRQTRCRGCGALFPFACAVCERSLRPPFPVYSDERYLSDEDAPLCQQHFQRQCPECEKWFQADKNPGFFLCPECGIEKTAQNQRDAMQPVAAAPARAAVVELDEAENILRAEEDAQNPLHSLIALVVWMVIIILLFALGRQIIHFLQPLVNGV